MTLVARSSSARSPRRRPGLTSTSSSRSGTAASAASHIDVKSETGREYFGRLLATADVFLTNWLPGALERARLTVEDIRAFNPNIIIARGTGMGVRGPDRDSGGFDAATYLSRGGVAYTLTPFGEHPAVQGPAFGDLQGGITLAGGLCAALFHRERTGEPSIVDSSLLAQAMWAIAPSISVADLFDLDGIPGAPPGLAMNPLVNRYKTSDDRYIQLVFLQPDRFWAGFCHRIGLPELADDPRFVPSSNLIANADEATALVGAAIARQGSRALAHGTRGRARRLGGAGDTQGDAQRPSGRSRTGTSSPTSTPRATNTRSSPRQCNSTRLRPRRRAHPSTASTPRRSCWNSISTGTTSRRPRTAARFSERESPMTMERRNLEAVIYEREPPIARIILNRPEKANTKDATLVQEVDACLREADRDKEIKVVILKANGKGFCGGHVARWGPDENPYPDFGDTFEDLYKGTADLFLWPTLYLWEFPKPTISQIHGYCMGGGIYLGSAHRLLRRIRGRVLPDAAGPEPRRAGRAHDDRAVAADELASHHGLVPAGANALRAGGTRLGPAQQGGAARGSGGDRRGDGPQARRRSR